MLGRSAACGFCRATIIRETAAAPGTRSCPRLRYRKPDGTVVALPKEHFGFTDAIGDPVFEGQYPGDYERARSQGNGAVDGTGNWRPLATGEFLLGYPDEAQEIAGAAMPLDFSRNGTFMAYRKLHQNVVAFNTFLDRRPRTGSAPFSASRSRRTRAKPSWRRWRAAGPTAFLSRSRRRPTSGEQFNARYPMSGPRRTRRL